MDKYAFLLGYFDKQKQVIERLFSEIKEIDVGIYAERYVFALKTQSFYTAIEDLLKQIAKSFENHIEKLDMYHKELLVRMNTEIPKIRPALLREKTFVFLDKLRAFRHFIRHAYDCELDPEELRLIQVRLKHEFSLFEEDLAAFRKYIEQLSTP